MGGACGCGDDCGSDGCDWLRKTTISRLLAERLGVTYAEADSFHPPANVVKMATGQALDDDDRYPWLVAIADWIRLRPGWRGWCGVLLSAQGLRSRYIA